MKIQPNTGSGVNHGVQETGDTHKVDSVKDEINQAAASAEQKLSGGARSEQGKTSARAEVAMTGHARAAELQSIASGFNPAAVNSDPGKIANPAPQQDAESIIGSALQKSGERLKNLGSAIKNGFEAVQKEGASIAEKGTVERPLDLDDVRNMANNAGKEISEAARQIKDIGNVEVDPGKPIEDMKDGDKITIGGGVSVGPGKASLGVKGSAELSKEGNNYKLSVDGQMAASLGLGIGGGGKVEMTFANAEEAKKALNAVKQSKPKNAADPQYYKAGGFTLTDLKQASAKLPDDYDFLKKHVSAVEVRQTWSAPSLSEAKGQLGVTQNAENTMRIEYKDGKPTQMTLKSSEKSGVAAGGSGNSAITLEQTFPIDENFPFGKLTQSQMSGKNPMDSFTPEEKKSWENAMKNSKYTVTSEGDIKYNSDIGGKGVHAEFKVTLSGKDLQDPKVLSAVKQAAKEAAGGDARKGMQTISKGTRIHAEAKVQTYETEGIDFQSPSAPIGIQVQATRQRTISTDSYSVNSQKEQTAQDIDAAAEGLE